MAPKKVRLAGKRRGGTPSQGRAGRGTKRRAGAKVKRSAKPETKRKTKPVAAKRSGKRASTKRMSTGEGKPGWKEIPPGGLILEAGNAAAYETGSWRTRAPAIDYDRCTNCLFCWIFCPDGAIEVKDGKVVGIDLYHCKGCGICARECPREAITMVDERRETHVS